MAFRKSKQKTAQQYQSPISRERDRQEFWDNLVWNFPLDASDREAVLWRHVVSFCNRTGRPLHLYEPEAMMARSKTPIAAVLPNGWFWLSLDYNAKSQRKRPTFNQAKLRRLCVKLRVPYWREMRDLEIRSVLMLWAIEVGVPELSIE